MPTGFIVRFVEYSHYDPHNMASVSKFWDTGKTEAVTS